MNNQDVWASGDSYEPYVVSLTDDKRAQLRERIHASLPFAPDGSIPMIARAWEVRGAK